jgi:predicted signal transduction protein with EAL and GGDEF domain
VPESLFRSGASSRSLCQLRKIKVRETTPALLPDLIVELRRDGSVIRQAGGPLPGTLRPETQCLPAMTDVLRQLTRRAIAARGTVEETMTSAGRCYEIRVTAHSPDRAVGMIRALALSDTLPHGEREGGGHWDRRRFWHRLTESISTASLGERSVALAVIHLDGIAEISQIMDTNASDQLIGTALDRLSSTDELTKEGEKWYAGQTGDAELTVVFNHADRDTIECSISLICESLRTRLDSGDASFYLKVYAGVAILGQDAGSQKVLLESARAATMEARRCEATGAHFYSDTLKLRALTRLDIAQELVDALANRDIRLRYRARHDLESGRLVAMVGYVCWHHPIRGEIPPARFLGAAAATGLAAALSRSVWEHIREDAQAILPQVADDVRISFGALRHHVIDGTLISDVESGLNERSIDPSRLELRISERIHATRDTAEWHGLADRGVRFVVDEVGRKLCSIERLAKAPIWGLQLDRASAIAMAHDATARKICCAVVAMARAMLLVPIATAVDTAKQRQYLLSIGCEQGSGDYYKSSTMTDLASTSRQFSHGS